MRDGWQVRPFEDCIEKVTYTQKVQRKDFLEDGAYPIVSQEEAFINGYWNDEEDVFSVKTPVVIFGDHTKIFKYVDFDFVLGADGVKILQPKDFLVPKFFYYQLQTADIGSLGYARHYRLLKELQVAYPDREEQKRIVAILDEAFESIATAKANAEKSLQGSQDLFDGYLESVFSTGIGDWPTRSLGEICGFDGGSQPPKSEFIHSPRAGYVRFIQIRDFGSDKNITYIPVSKKNRLCEMEDILIGRYGASVGKILTGLAGAYNVALIKTSPDPRLLDRDYFYQYLKSRAFQVPLMRVAARSAQDGFSKEDISGFAVPLPSLSVQRAVVGRIGPLSTEVRRVAKIYEQKLAALDDLKKSLLHHAFSGQL